MLYWNPESDPQTSGKSAFYLKETLSNLELICAPCCKTVTLPTSVKDLYLLAESRCCCECAHNNTTHQQSTELNFSILTCLNHLKLRNNGRLWLREAICGKQATAVWRVQRGQTLPPQLKQCLHTHTRCFKFYANDLTEKDVSRPIIHCSLPKHLINGLIQALYVAYNKALKHAGKECGSDEGLWIPTEPDHIKHLNHYPSSLLSSHHAVPHTVPYFVPADLSVTGSSEHGSSVQLCHCMRQTAKKRKKQQKKKK